jgi:hypothetical protein
MDRGRTEILIWQSLVQDRRRLDQMEPARTSRQIIVPSRFVLVSSIGSL